MPTIVTRFLNVVAPSSAPVINLPSQTEIALLQSPNLQEWWRPDSGYNVNDRWIDKKNGQAMQRIGSTLWPDVLTGLNGKSYLYRSTGTNQFATFKNDANSDAKFPMPPARGYTFSWVGKPILFDRPAFCAIFAAGATSSADVVFVGYDNTSRKVVARHRGISHINYTLPDPEVEHSIVITFDYETMTGVLYVDGVEVASGTSATLPQSEPLTLFGPYAADGTALGNGSFAGHVYDKLAFNDALHMSRNADELNTLNNYITERYGL